MTAIPQSGPRSFGFQRSQTHTHQGIDLPQPEGTPVYAVLPGTVRFASAELSPGFSGYGGHVAIEHEPDLWTLYAHLQSVEVEPGQTVRPGDRLGEVGRTCYSRAEPAKLCSGPHLHFELSPRRYPQDSEAPRLDPSALLERVGGPDSLFSPNAGVTMDASSNETLAEYLERRQASIDEADSRAAEITRRMEQRQRPGLTVLARERGRPWPWILPDPLRQIRPWLVLGGAGSGLLALLLLSRGKWKRR